MELAIPSCIGSCPGAHGISNAPGSMSRIDPLPLENHATDERIALSKEAFKHAFLDNLYYVQGKTPALATKHDYFMALAYTVRDRMLHRWISTAATYTEPGIGSVGLTEAQAKAQGYKVKVGKFPFLANSKATIVGMHDGFVKVVEDEKSGEILGVHIIGPQGFELIAEAVVAMEAEATVETLMYTIHAHPTLSETIAFSAEAFEGTLTDLYIPKR